MRGDLAKLVFRFVEPAADGCTGERMWCRIQKRDGNVYVGELVSHPHYLDDVQAGDRIRFRPRQIAAIERKEEGHLPPLAGVSAGVLFGGRWPRVILRTAPENEYDSGFRVFTGREARSALLRALSLETLFRAWAVTDSVIDAETDGIWIWSERQLEYRRAKKLPPPLDELAKQPLGRLHAGVPPVSQLAIVTRPVLDGKRPERARRFRPKRGEDDDSGWVFYVGSETQRELDDPNKCALIPLTRLLHLHPFVERVLGEPPGSEWSWDRANADWQPLSSSTRRAASRSPYRRTKRSRRRPT